MIKILVVDNSVQSTDLIRKCLSLEGFEILTSESGLNALAKIEVFNPDLLIMGVELPDISGFDVLKKLRQKPESEYTLVLLLTLEDTKDVRIRSLEIGADDIIQKNFDSSVLTSKVMSLIHVKNLRDQLKAKYVELEEKNNLLNFQLKMAQNVQKALLPDVDFEFNESKFLSRYLPALDIGGDFYDVILQIDKDCIFVAIGDVSGHGISAALLTAMLGMMVKNLSSVHSAPNRILAGLNTEFCRIFENSDQEMFACVFFAIINTHEQRIYFSNAGQALPIYLNAKESVAFELNVSGLPIGLMLDSKYEVKTIDYNKGDILFFHTDGLSDTFYKDNPDDFSAKLKEILIDTSLYDPKEILDIIQSAFYNYNASEAQKYQLDDVSMIICKL